MEDLPDGIVRADRDAIHQVFTNLIENAVKYGGPGGRVQIGVKSKGPELEFYVRDLVRGSLPSICRACSSVSIVWTRPARRMLEGPAWGWRS